ncbi:MAG TPA: sigma-70 family RNA polymerase sigma factor [Opitutaceae bacterium]|nr:sigma-70 family RNA polymerase sigma factor [Opitutaceae bacterium]
MEARDESREAGAEKVAEAAGEDRELMARVQRGDEAALGALMERWELPVKSVVGRLVLNASEAEELAQETFVRVWQQRGKFRAGAEFRPWVFAIAVNLARNRLRWWRRRPSVSLEEWSEGEEPGARSQENAGKALERGERAAAVREAIAALPTELREAIVLFEYERLSQAEIATAVGATVKAVETRIYRAKEKLRTALRSQL